MDSEKLLGSSSDSSSEEQESEAIIKADSEYCLTNKRSYGCIFCKRGFTNAQALGGHMNIHRKDRANKPKQITTSSSSYSSSSCVPSKQIEDSNFMNTLYFGRPRVDFEESGSNPRGYFQELGDLNKKQELWGSDLSLQIGPSKGRIRRGTIWNNNGEGLDLELRLGHDHHY